MWTYQNTDELYHYGVLGMKWGVRKYNKYSDKVKRLTKKRNEVYNKKGAISKSFIKTSKNLYYAKSKKEYYNAKTNGTKADVMAKKEQVKWAKSIKRNGTANIFGTRSVYGNKPTPNEMTAINIKEIRNDKIKSVGRKASRIALSVVGPIALTAGLTELQFKKKYGRFGKPSISFENGIPKITVTG